MFDLSQDSFLRVISAARIGAFNFHPSLLPAYKGPTPTKQCLLNGEKETGITIHTMTEEVDSGIIISRRKLSIERYFDDGILRQYLSVLQYPLLLDLFRFLDGDENLPQDNETIKSSIYPAFVPQEVTYVRNYSIRRLWQQVRASSPFPGLSLSVNGELYRVTKPLFFVPMAFDTSIKIDGSEIEVRGPDGLLKVIGEKV